MRSLQFIYRNVEVSMYRLEKNLYIIFMNCAKISKKVVFAFCARFASFALILAISAL